MRRVLVFNLVHLLISAYALVGAMATDHYRGEVSDGEMLHPPKLEVHTTEGVAF